VDDGSAFKAEYIQGHLESLLAQNMEILAPEGIPDDEACEEPQEVVTPEMVTEIQDEVDLLRKQRAEAERTAREVEESAAKEEDLTKAEIQKLKDGKKSDERAKLKLKQNVKGLEEAKARVDLHKVKLEKESRGEATTKKSLTVKLDTSAQQQIVVTDSITGLEFLGP